MTYNVRALNSVNQIGEHNIDILSIDYIIVN